MLSGDIRNLRSTLGAALAERRLYPSLMDLALQRLDALADQAAAIEDMVIPLGGQLNEHNMPANVVRLAGKPAGAAAGLPKGGTP